MSKESLSNYIGELLSPDTIEQLKPFNEKEINRQITTSLLEAMKPLPLKYITTLLKNLESLTGDDEESKKKINNFLWLHKKIFLWDKYRLVVIVIFTLLICLLIYFIGK